GALEGVGPHAGEVAAPVGDAAQAYRLRVVGAQDLADRRKAARRVVPDLPVDDVDDVLLRQLQPLRIRLGNVIDSDGARQEALQTVRGEARARDMALPQRVALESGGQVGLDRPQEGVAAVAEQRLRHQRVYPQPPVVVAGDLVVEAERL